MSQTGPINPTSLEQLLFSVASLTAEIYGIKDALIEKGVLSRVEIAEQVEKYRNQMGPDVSKGLAILEAMMRNNPKGGRQA
jgi:hypothetical protein